MGVGIINFVFALPAFYTIDAFGRRNLLPVTSPFLAMFQVLNAVSTKLLPGKAQIGLTIAGMYLFSIAYSPGAGPVSFERILFHESIIIGAMFQYLYIYRFMRRRVCPYTFETLVGFLSFNVEVWSTSHFLILGLRSHAERNPSLCMGLVTAVNWLFNFVIATS